MVGRRTTATIAALAGVVLVASGCGSKTDGKAGPTTTDTSAATAALWDPCVQISEAALKQIGVDPATKESGVAGVEEPGWKVCSWNNSDFNLGVFSTVRTVEEFKKKPDNTDFADVTIGGRTGLRFRQTFDKDDKICDLLFSTAQGTVDITVSNRVSSKNKVSPCERAGTAAEILMPGVPR
ncbi:DUF3558 domain-containing protein [Nocardia sp. XZ_19_385]|uniref:DUF3558 domain-containing protein n=1 Tax=Nocardia sp. XZ_19_385 TaxID=2769488 RepID=UPI00188F4DAD|nr:DUF3558 domain-containing protein [Nocardia sp. XZ_19_385]